ncbi:MAG: filamentous hemagglutinin N-terminal domain-containing protein [Candidatus Omnitrophica bacterium]|nr:filamentous hemagglutinin N-terminal domain-containing protein [Candidatus Omnitrophota bacterium]
MCYSFKKLNAMIMVAAMTFMPVQGYAQAVLPEGGTIVEGNGHITTVGSDMTVRQYTDKMIADWTSFSISSGASVEFKQLHDTSIALNRVTGVNPSEIMGRLAANGRIFLVNPNGILFGAGSRVDTNGLLASTLPLNMTDDQFMGEDEFLRCTTSYGFSGVGGSVINRGELMAPGGFVALLGGYVENSGIINVNNESKYPSLFAERGSVVLASGKAATVNLDGSGTISLVVDQATDTNLLQTSSAVINTASGQIIADGGKVLLTAKVLDDLFSKAVNNEGIIEANGAEGDCLINYGTVKLESSHDVYNSGTISAGDVDIVAGKSAVIDNGGVYAQKNRGDTQVTVNAADVSIVNGSEVSAVTGDGDALVDIVSGGPITISDSTLLAEVGHPTVDFLTLSGYPYEGDCTERGYHYAEIYLDPKGPGDVTVSGSSLTAHVENEGHAAIYMYNDTEGNVIDIPGLDSFDIGEPVDGSINITDSTLSASADDVATTSETALVYMNADKDITITGSFISASENAGVAAIAMLAGGDIGVDSQSTIQSTAVDGLAAVAGVAGSSDILDPASGSLHLNGSITADGGLGAGVVAFLAAGDVDASGSIEARGELDTLGLLSHVSSWIFHKTIDIHSDANYGSAILLGSMAGNITLGDIGADLVGVAALGLDEDGGSIAGTEGVVNANYLALIAGNNIGTKDAPINTNVDILSAYSADVGDIYINEANDIELGMYLPITISEDLPSSIMSRSELPSMIDIGFSVAANNGTIHVVSAGDMTVNSVIAPRGDVYLESTGGSIYAGHGWDPTVGQSVVNEIGSLGADVASWLGYTLDPEDAAHWVGDALMANPFAGESENAEYLSPVMAGTPMEPGANVIAVGNTSLIAKGSVGTSDAPIQTKVDNLTAIAKGGDVNIEEEDGLNLVDIQALGSTVNITAGGDMAVGSVLAEGGSSIDPANIFLSAGGDMTSSGGSVLARNLEGGDAQVELAANDIALINGTSVGAEVADGNARIDLKAKALGEDAASVSILNKSSVQATVSGSGSAAVNVYTNFDGIGCVGVSSELPKATITVDNSVLRAAVQENGTAKVNVDYYTDAEGFYYWMVYQGADINVLGGSNFAAEVLGNGTTEVNVSDHLSNYYEYYYNNFLSGDVNIDASSLTSAVTGAGKASITIGRNLDYYWGGVDNKGNITITDSDLSATAASASNEDSEAAVVSIAGRNINITGTSILALQSDAAGSGDTFAWIWAIGQYSGEGSVLLSNTDVASTVTGSGDAQNYVYAYGNYYGYHDGEDANNGNLSILDGSNITASSGVDASSTMGHSAYIYLYAYGYGLDSGKTRIDQSTVASDVKGSGYAQTYVQNYNYYNDPEDNSPDVLVSNSRIASTVESPDSSDGNWAQVSMYTYGSGNSSTNLQDMTVSNSTIEARATGGADAHVYLESHGHDAEHSCYGSSVVNVLNSTVNAIASGADSRATLSIRSGDVNLMGSKLNAFDGLNIGSIYAWARWGSILGDANTLISGNILTMEAYNDIGTKENPINTAVDVLRGEASSYGYSDVSLLADENGDGQAMPLGSFYVNEVDDLIVGGYGDYERGGEGDGYFEPVVANNGIVSIVAGGSLLINEIDAPRGGVYLETKQGSIYAGTPEFSDYNVTAGGDSYFSALKGMIGVGNPGDAFNGISGQITGVVDPGEVAVTGVEQAPALDLRFGPPAGSVYYQDERRDEGSGAPIGSIWPVPGSLDLMNNPLRVNIAPIEGGFSAVPPGFVPTSSLTLLLGSLASLTVDPALLANALLRDNRAYYELLERFRFQSFEPATPTGFYAYHPLTTADMGAYNDIGLDPDAYEFIEGQINYKGEPDPYQKRKTAM